MSLPRFRWVIFLRSLVAVDEHPPAQVFRALGRLLAQQNQEAVFLEERGNPLTVAALRRRGAAALRELARDWPELRYHTVERRSGADLVEWLGRTLATADIALVELGVDQELARWVGELTRPHLHTVLVDLVPDAADLEWLRHTLDPASYTAVICHPANLGAYRGRTSARRIVTVEGTPEQLAAAIAEGTLAAVLQAARDLTVDAPGANGLGPGNDQPSEGGRG
ncbi:MAG: hypothetical protein RMK01_04375 [Thermomicrobium sp.]|nr:hypothetical protein [Thermomicrobium sp.]